MHWLAFFVLQSINARNSSKDYPQAKQYGRNALILTVLNITFSLCLALLIIGLTVGLVCINPADYSYDYYNGYVHLVYYGKLVCMYAYDNASIDIIIYHNDDQYYFIGVCSQEWNFMKPKFNIFITLSAVIIVIVCVLTAFKYYILW